MGKESTRGEARPLETDVTPPWACLPRVDSRHLDCVHDYVQNGHDATNCVVLPDGVCVCIFIYYVLFFLSPSMCCNEPRAKETQAVTCPSATWVSRKLLLHDGRAGRVNTVNLNVLDLMCCCQRKQAIATTKQRAGIRQAYRCALWCVERTFGMPQEVVELTKTRSTMQLSLPLMAPRPTTLPFSMPRVITRSLSDVSVIYHINDERRC